MAVAAARAEAKGEGPGSKLDRHLVLAELADVRFSGASGPVSFDANLDREASGVPFSIFCQTEAPDAAEGNWKMLAVPIGSYVPGTGIAKLKDADFEWSSRERGWGKLLRADYRCRCCLPPRSPIFFLKFFFCLKVFSSYMSRTFQKTCERRAKKQNCKASREAESLWNVW